MKQLKDSRNLRKLAAKALQMSSHLGNCELQTLVKLMKVINSKGNHQQRLAQSRLIKKAFHYLPPTLNKKLICALSFETSTFLLAAVLCLIKSLHLSSFFYPFTRKAKVGFNCAELLILLDTLRIVKVLDGNGCENEAVNGGRAFFFVDEAKKRAISINQF